LSKAGRDRDRIATLLFDELQHRKKAFVLRLRFEAQSITDPEARKIFLSEIDGLGHLGLVSWAMLRTLESALLRHLPASALPGRIALLREEYERLSTNSGWTDHLKSAPSLDKADESVLQNYAARLAEDVQRLREGRYNILLIRAWHTIVGIGFAALLISLAFSHEMYTPWSISIVVASMFAATIGGCLSMLARLFSISAKGDIEEPSWNYVARLRWFLSPFLSLCEACLAGIIVYFLLQSQLAGVLPPALRPNFTALATYMSSRPPTTAPSTDESVRKVESSWQLYSIPNDSTDVAKIMIWCVLAGFAERLVPDALNQLATKAASKERR
jgi:hypothetical protein